MPFIDLPVDIILSITHFLSYVELASLVRTNTSLAHLLIPSLYNPILKSEQSPKNPYYGLPWPSWIDCIGEWRSPYLLNHFKKTPIQNLAYTGMHRATLVHLAAQENNAVLFEILLSRGFTLEQEDFFGRTPLHYALDNNQEEMINYLLDAGADIMAKKGYSLLLAAERCSRAVVTRIVEQMNAREARFKPFEFTGFPTDNTVQMIKDLAINAATVRRSRGLVNLLIRHGANPDYASDSEVSINVFREWMLGMVRRY